MYVTGRSTIYKTNHAMQLIEDALVWLKDNYDDHLCWNEADMERVIWDRLRRQIKERGLPLSIRSQPRIYFAKDYYMPDLALFDAAGNVLTVLEIKYEPAPSRPGIPSGAKITTLSHLIPGMSPRTDIEKITRCVRESKAETGYFIFIDEDSHHLSRNRHLDLPAGTAWIEWQIKTKLGHSPSILVSRFPS